MNGDRKKIKESTEALAVEKRSGFGELSRDQERVRKKAKVRLRRRERRTYKVKHDYCLQP